MPHDRNGELLKGGDKVVLPGTIISVLAGEDYCNVTLETDIPCLPGTCKGSYYLNAGQVEKVGSAPQGGVPEGPDPGEGEDDGPADGPGR